MKSEAVTIPFDVSESGNYLVFARVWPRKDAGIYDFYLDSTLLIKERDIFEKHHFVTDIKLGHMHNLAKSRHEIKAIYKGSNLSGIPGHQFMDAIVLEPVGVFEKRNTD